MKIKEFDTVLLKDGREAFIVDKLSEEDFISDIGDEPATWEAIDICIDDIERVLQKRE